MGKTEFKEDSIENQLLRETASLINNIQIPQIQDTVRGIGAIAISYVDEMTAKDLLVLRLAQRILTELSVKSQLAAVNKAIEEAKGEDNDR